MAAQLQGRNVRAATYAARGGCDLREPPYHDRTDPAVRAAPDHAALRHTSI